MAYDYYRVTCEVCGQQFSMITWNHLKTHGLTTKEYKKKYGEDSLSSDYKRDCDRDRILKQWKDNKFSSNVKAAASKQMKRLREDPEFVKKLHEASHNEETNNKRIASVRKFYSSKEGKRKRKMIAVKNKKSWTKEKKAKHSKMLKEQYKNNPERKRKLSESLREAHKKFPHMHNHFKSDEFRSMMSDKMKKRFASMTKEERIEYARRLNEPKSSSKSICRCYYTDINLRRTFPFRSIAECVTAFLLDIIGVTWKYEPFLLTFENLTYLPDFIIDDFIVEVKDGQKFRKRSNIEKSKRKVDKAKTVAGNNGYTFELVEIDSIFKEVGAISYSQFKRNSNLHRPKSVRKAKIKKRVFTFEEIFDGENKVYKKDWEATCVRLAECLRNKLLCCK